jgi:hypothetical protein
MWVNKYINISIRFFKRNILQGNRKELAGMPSNISFSIIWKYGVKKQALLTVLLARSIDLTR